ncbi:hypothetical protein ACS0TY_027757 [Phlomoides rotata]
MSDLFRGQTIFKAIRPQISFPYLDERRFRGLSDVRPVHRSDLIQGYQTSFSYLDERRFRGRTSFKAIRPQTSFPYLDERRFRGLSDVRPIHRSDLIQGYQTSFPYLDERRFRGRTSFKAIRPQTSFPYLDERRFRGLSDVRPIHRSDLIQGYQTSDLISLS